MVLMLSLAMVLGTVGRNFYIDPDGNDKADGLSLAHAWKSLEPVGRVSLLPGDRVVLTSGATFTGNLVLSGKGTARQPIVVESTGRAATIISRSKAAISLTQGGFEIRNLILKGGAKTKLSGNDGVSIVPKNGESSSYLKLDQLDISGFGGAGIAILAEKSSSAKLSNVRITNVKSHDNFGAGLITQDGGSYLGKEFNYSDFRVTDSDFSRNKDGSGIVLSGLDGALVEFCTARGNVGKGGGVGMWAWCAKNVTFRHCISSGTTTDGGDGGGFDLDGGTVDCVVEQCLTYDNAGPGYMHCDYPSAPRTQRNSIRNNIALDDGRKAKGDVIGFGLVSWGSGLYDCSVTGNVGLLDVKIAPKPTNGVMFMVYIRSSSDSVEAQQVQGAVFRDNRVILGSVAAAFTSVALPKRNEGDISFARNLYSGKGAFVEGDASLDSAEWLKEHPEDAVVTLAGPSMNLRKLSARDLPSVFQSGWFKGK
ncbi:hypothetical protein BH11ARM1_BH11ARM1_03190 [soil metagenome]